MKEYQTLIGLGLIGLAIFFGLQNIAMTEFDACMKNGTKANPSSTEYDQYYHCGLMIRGR